MSPSVTPVEVVKDEPAELLDYLARRTAETLGGRVDRSNAVVEGAVSGIETATVHEGGARLLVDVASLEVDRVAAGDVHPQRLTLVHARRATGTEPLVPDVSLSAGDRGLWFLQRVGADAAEAAAADAPAYRLTPPALGPSQDEETAQAVDWYAAHDGPAAGLDHPNPLVVHEAVRVLAERADPDAIATLRRAAEGGSEDLRLRIAAALWRAGRHAEALEVAGALMDDDAREAWLARWGLARSHDHEGRPTGELYGPAAAGASP